MPSLRTAECPGEPTTVTVSVIRPHGRRVTTDLAALRDVADYQFGAGAGTALFPEGDDCRIDRMTTGRPQQIHVADGRLVSYGTDGRFTLGFVGGQRLHSALDPPTARVTVGTESESFVRDGHNAFAKFVRGVDPAIRPADEVLVVDRAGDLLGVGRAELPARGMLDLGRGVAVSIREGAGTGDPDPTQ